ncbi:putative sporulation protein YtaF [Texcoconibacillus texcoconensis]|uniref:Putative sporulation protein YtaF n=2 Tax=Texcoconibacillus texcoconensis TaxID=1095777 RepID=A0A840QMZ4_9BACI|nr:putative sporulation protein YtaF [Texcoconibacillus texcoconensis]
MIELFSLIMLSFAVSLDSFGVGLTYGLRKMKLPRASLLFIASCSALTVLLAMTIGNVISAFMSPEVAESIGGVILVLIGAWALYQTYRPAKRERKSKKDKKDDVLFTLEIKVIGVMIRVLRKPMVADLDDSGTITGREAFLLGLALSMDAFGAGLGAALMGYSPIMMAVTVGLMCGFFLFLGMKSGYRFSDNKWMSKLKFLPGVLLITLGLWEILL